MSVIRFVRRTPRNAAEVEWYPNRGVLAVDDLRGLDATNLGGEPIIGRWTSAEKILRSRVNGTTLLADRLTKVDHECALVSASAIGYYGSTLPNCSVKNRLLVGILGDVCAQWEAVPVRQNRWTASRYAENRDRIERPRGCPQANAASIQGGSWWRCCNR